MTEPLLVVHGIGNRDPEAFEHSLTPLRKQLAGRFDLIPVFWGDLGGISQALEDSLPLIFPQERVTRGDAAASTQLAPRLDPTSAQAARFFELLQQQRSSLMGESITRAGPVEPVDAIYAATISAIGLPDLGQTRVLTRSADDDLRRALSEALPETDHLKHLRDPQLQQAVGELIAEFLQVHPAIQAGGTSAGGTPQITTRGWFDDTRSALKRFIEKVDQLVGKMAGDLGGSLNRLVRHQLAGPIALTLGDIVAYHQRRPEIHQRLFQRLDELAPGWGTVEKPIHVMAHSLGGLLTLDAALGSDVLLDDASARKLHIKHWVTFGSQPAFFHVMTPLRGIDVYRPQHPSRLPANIGRWTNFWHPLDALAFSAAPVFQLQDSSAPQDVRLDTPASDIVDAKGWLHSIYWESPKLGEALL